MDSSESGAPVTLGRILRAHGVRGALIVAADPSVHDAIRPGLHCRLVGDAPGGREAVVAAVATHPAGLRVHFVDLESREAAQEIVGAELRVARAQMPASGQDEYYDYEIVGLAAVDADGDRLGDVVEIIATGAHDVYVIRGDGGELLVPATAACVLAVDLEHGRVVVDRRTVVESP